MAAIRDYVSVWGHVGAAMFIPVVGFGLFFIELLVIILPEAGMFMKRYGRRHRLIGMVHLAFLIGGLINILCDVIPSFVYDSTLCLMGIALVRSAY